MKLIYLGAEVPSNRIILEEAGATYMGVSYHRLVKRGLPKTKAYLLENYFKLGKIKTLFGPQVDISSSKIRKWFKEGQFEKISQVILPITYQHLRKLYLQGHLLGYYRSANATFKTLPTTKSLYQT